MVAPSLLWTIVAVPSVGTAWGPIADWRLSGIDDGLAAVQVSSDVESCDYEPKSEHSKLEARQCCCLVIRARKVHLSSQTS